MLNLKKLLKSFRFAFQGLRFAGKENNLRFHLLAAAAVLAVSAAVRLQPWEWVAVVLSITLVISAEIANTAIERLTDLVSPTHHPLAGQVKDLAAAAVLVAAAGAVVVAIIVFLPYIQAYLARFS
jgi:diacylglycerol kinase (ATP)